MEVTNALISKATPSEMNWNNGIQGKMKGHLKLSSRLTIQDKVSVDIRNEETTLHIVYDQW